MADKQHDSSTRPRQERAIPLEWWPLTGEVPPQTQQEAPSREGVSGETPSSMVPGNTSDEVEGLYVISVAARLLSLHPQTLRKYERLGFITPSRTEGMLRLYSQEDIAKLRVIKQMVERGLNLAGVDMALDIFTRLLDLQQRVRGLDELQELRETMVQELVGILEKLDAQLFNK